MAKKLNPITKAEKDFSHQLTKSERQAVVLTKLIFSRKRYNRFLRLLGPGLVTGASDDDPSGIGTYSQAGAQYGYGLLWALLLSYPLMVGIQEISARIGRVTVLGIAGNLQRHLPRWLAWVLVALLALANVINLGVYLGAM